jgi:hypothetical protein
LFYFLISVPWGFLIVLLLTGMPMLGELILIENLRQLLAQASRLIPIEPN